METDEPDVKRRKSFSKREIVQKLKIGEKMPFLQLTRKLATVFSSEMLLFGHTFNLISLV